MEQVAEETTHTHSQRGVWTFDSTETSKNREETKRRSWDTVTRCELAEQIKQQQEHM